MLGVCGDMCGGVWGVWGYVGGVGYLCVSDNVNARLCVSVNEIMYVCEYVYQYMCVYV